MYICRHRTCHAMYDMREIKSRFCSDKTKLQWLTSFVRSFHDLASGASGSFSRYTMYSCAVSHNQPLANHINTVFWKHSVNSGHVLLLLQMSSSSYRDNENSNSSDLTFVIVRRPFGQHFTPLAKCCFVIYSSKACEIPKQACNIATNCY